MPTHSKCICPLIYLPRRQLEWTPYFHWLRSDSTESTDRCCCGKICTNALPQLFFYIARPKSKHLQYIKDKLWLSKLQGSCLFKGATGLWNSPVTHKEYNTLVSSPIRSYRADWSGSASQWLTLKLRHSTRDHVTCVWDRLRVNMRQRVE